MVDGDLTDELAALIARDGPIPIARFMALAGARYYATRDPFGAAGDFVTAPEISQMFGEIIGLALADLWDRAGRRDATYVELGPGRGTLAVDARRAMAAAGLVPPLHLVEISPTLRARQREWLPDATWHDDIDTLPTDRPLLIVANEFFDALPVRQLVRTVWGWRERMVTYRDGEFVAVPGEADVRALVPLHLREAEPGSIVERGEAAATLATALARRLAAQGGALLVIDYGYRAHAGGDTLQAVSAHAFADPLARPGTRDLTAHVDFQALAGALAAGGASVAGPVPQGAWLVTLGLAQRAAALVRAHPAREHEVAEAHRRLTDRDEMGELFKVLAASGRGWPAIAGLSS